MIWPAPKNWQWGPAENETLCKEMISIHIVTFPFTYVYVATLEQHQHMEHYISQSIQYPSACVSYQAFPDRMLVLYINNEAT